jgi:hypothetical protein
VADFFPPFDFFSSFIGLLRVISGTGGAIDDDEPNEVDDPTESDDDDDDEVEVEVERGGGESSNDEK